MSDKAHKYTDRQLERLENRIARYYVGSRQAVRKHTEQELEEYQEVDELIASGEISKRELKETAKNSSFPKTIAVFFAASIVVSHEKAFKDIQKTTDRIYLENYSYIAKAIQKATGKKLKYTTAPKNLSKQSRRTYNRLTDTIHISEKLEAYIRDKIVQGWGIDKIKRGILGEFNKQQYSSVLTARTESTRIENGARLSGFDDAQAAGVTVYKEWFATIGDGRTRDSHILLHGEVQPLGVPFSNGLIFPGDPEGEAAEVCNCRCVLIPNFTGVRTVWAA